MIKKDFFIKLNQSFVSKIEDLKNSLENISYNLKNAFSIRKLAFSTLVILLLASLPFPSIAEQQAIVNEIETRLSVCDKLEQDITDSLEKAEALRQSILKQAFEGKLLNEQELAAVRNDPEWEPAEALLAKIKSKTI